MVLGGTTIYGVTFYSNDVTVFPEVRLVSDARGARPPAFASQLRSVEGVSGQAGYTTVSFEPYAVEANEFIWVVVRFPNRDAISGDGVGGGAGIGWANEKHLLEQRSFFGTDESINEFTKAFDIALVTEPIPNTLKAATRSDDAAESSRSANGRVAVFDPQIRPGSVILHFALRASAPVEVGILDVSGRRIRVLEHGVLSRGAPQTTYSIAGCDSSEKTH
jgi:hypothetical protein